MSSLVWSDSAWADYFNCYQKGNCDPPTLSDSLICEIGANKDYHRKSISDHRGEVDYDVIVLSIHGGLIEANTSEIGEALRSRNIGWDYYTFIGHARSACQKLGEPDGNFGALHITSIHFDEPIAISAVGRHQKAVAIHGHGRNYSRGTICVGGKNQEQINEFIKYVNSNKGSFSNYSLKPINAATATSGDCAVDALRGTDSQNIVNRCKSRCGGLQLELTSGMRKDLVDPDSTYNTLRDVIYGGVTQAMHVGACE